MTSWTVAHQVPQSVGFHRQEYWNRLPFPSLEALPDPGIESVSPASLALAGGFFTTEPPGEPLYGRETSKHSFSLIIKSSQLVI